MGCGARQNEWGGTGGEGGRELSDHTLWQVDSHRDTLRHPFHFASEFMEKVKSLVEQKLEFPKSCPPTPHLCFMPPRLPPGSEVKEKERVISLGPPLPYCLMVLALNPHTSSTWRRRGTQLSVFQLTVLSPRHLQGKKRKISNHACKPQIGILQDINTRILFLHPVMSLTQSGPEDL